MLESIDFTHSSRKARQTTNKLTGRTSMHSRCPITANSIASQLLKNGRFPDAGRNFNHSTSHAVCLLSNSASIDANLSADFTKKGIVDAISKLMSGKSSGRDYNHPEFIIHQSDGTTNWLCSFFSSCLRRFQLPRTWCRATVIAISKPNSHQRFQSHANPSHFSVYHSIF